jgi:hypothetical protein
MEDAIHQLNNPRIEVKLVLADGLQIIVVHHIINFVINFINKISSWVLRTSKVFGKINLDSPQIASLSRMKVLPRNPYGIPGWVPPEPRQSR